jgi:hypothetical protein
MDCLELTSNIQSILATTTLFPPPPSITTHFFSSPPLTSYFTMPLAVTTAQNQIHQTLPPDTNKNDAVKLLMAEYNKHGKIRSEHLLHKLTSFQLKTDIMGGMKIPTTSITRKAQMIDAILGRKSLQEIKKQKDEPKPAPKRKRKTKSLHFRAPGYEMDADAGPTPQGANPGEALAGPSQQGTVQGQAQQMPGLDAGSSAMNFNPSGGPVFSFSTPVPNASSQFNFNALVPVSYVGLPFNNPPVPASYMDPRFNSNNAIFDGSQLDLSWNLAPVVDNQAESALYPDASIQNVGQMNGGFDFNAPVFDGSQVDPVSDPNAPFQDVGQMDVGFDPYPPLPNGGRVGPYFNLDPVPDSQVDSASNPNAPIPDFGQTDHGYDFNTPFPDARQAFDPDHGILTPEQSQTLDPDLTPEKAQALRDYINSNSGTSQV